LVSGLSKDSTSKSGFHRQLPLEPRILNAATQVALTEKFLLPALPEVEVFFLGVRNSVDAILRNARPEKLGLAYPRGQCLEITLGVQKLLRHIDAARLDAAVAPGYAAFTAFRAAGGTFRHVWGDLRGEFFQNAFQLGTLYLDVANDSVVITKPKVEILPFADAQLIAITDFHHFTRLAARYWKDRIFPNHVLPELAPYFPLVHVSSQGTVMLRELSTYMLGLATSKQFLCSEEVLQDPAMPDAVFRHVTQALANQGVRLPASPAAGRMQALKFCREYRQKRWYASEPQTKRMIAEAQKAVRCLVEQPALPELYDVEAHGDEVQQESVRTRTC
jgi:hypothetical protein